MVNWIQESYQEKRRIRYDDIHQWLQAEYNTSALPNTFSKIITSIDSLNDVQRKHMGKRV
jgi:hypothetical protein